MSFSLTLVQLVSVSELAEALSVIVGYGRDTSDTSSLSSHTKTRSTKPTITHVVSNM